MIQNYRPHQFLLYLSHDTKLLWLRSGIPQLSTLNYKGNHKPSSPLMGDKRQRLQAEVRTTDWKKEWDKKMNGSSNNTNNRKCTKERGIYMKNAHSAWPKAVWPQEKEQWLKASPPRSRLHSSPGMEYLLWNNKPRGAHTAPRHCPLTATAKKIDLVLAKPRIGIIAVPGGLLRLSWVVKLWEEVN